MHGLLLLWWLAVDDAVPQVSEILQERNDVKEQTLGGGPDLRCLLPSRWAGWDPGAAGTSTTGFYSLRRWWCSTPWTASARQRPRHQRKTNIGATLELISDLLDHLRMLLHDVEEAIVRCHGSGPLFRGTRQLLKQVGDYVVQTGTAACAYHRICSTHTNTHSM